jgi:hypothetical protein
LSEADSAGKRHESIDAISSIEEHRHASPAADRSHLSLGWPVGI